MVRLHLRIIKLWIIILSLTGILVSLGCHKCHPIQLPSLEFTNEDKAINPYSGNERLVFKNTINDSLVYTCEGRNLYSSEIVYGKNYAANYDGCEGDNYFANMDFTLFNLSDGRRALDIRLYFSNYFVVGKIQREIYLYINSIKSIVPFSTYFNFEPDTLLNGDSIYHSFEYGKIVSFHDTISFGTHTFNSIYELGYGHYIANPNYDEYLSTIYYSITEGVVGFKSNSGKMWYLESKSPLE